MFFTEYDPLTEEEVFRKLDAQRLPTGGGCGCLVGKRFSARLEGEFAPQQLEYEFKDAATLQCKENGMTFSAPYAAVCLGRIAMFSHLVPGTVRGFHCILDLESAALTVFETWFGVEVPLGTDPMGKLPPTGGMQSIPREVQRQYSIGWADFGSNEAPEKRPTPTNRLEGRGLYWRFSTGEELLSFFPSVVYTTIVALGKAEGGITVAQPSDFLRIDDAYYIFSRGEVEFSGKLYIELINFLDCTAVGLEFGFDEANRFVYGFRSAKLKITGDAAHLEPITDYGDETPPHNKSGKGGRYAYRPKNFAKPATHEEALRLAAEHSVILEDNSANRMASKNGLEPSAFLVGKQFKVRPDCAPHTASPWAGDRSIVYEYDVLSPSLLRWRVGGGDWQ